MVTPAHMGASSFAHPFIMIFFCFLFFLFGFFRLFSFNEWICGLDSNCASHLLPPPAPSYRGVGMWGPPADCAATLWKKSRQGVRWKRRERRLSGKAGCPPLLPKPAYSPKRMKLLCDGSGTVGLGQGRGPRVAQSEPSPTPPNTCSYALSLPFLHHYQSFSLILAPTAQARLPQSFGYVCILAYSLTSHYSPFLLTGYP